MACTDGHNDARRGGPDLPGRQVLPRRRDRRSRAAAGPEPDGWLGVDLGIVNIAADSDGNAYCGKAVRAVRYRNRQLRARLQSKGTKSAKRLLARRRRKESRFARDVNHVISKTIVREAKDTGRGIKLEDLSGIRDRTTVRKAQRADPHSWSFYQLRAVHQPTRPPSPGSRWRWWTRATRRGGAPDAATSTSGTARRDQFRCKRCGLAGPADNIAASEHQRLGSRHAAGRGVTGASSAKPRPASSVPQGGEADVSYRRTSPPRPPVPE